MLTFHEHLISPFPGDLGVNSYMYSIELYLVLFVIQLRFKKPLYV